MIKINKRGIKVPKILRKDGAQKCRAHIQAYTLSPRGYHLNTRARTKFDFDSSIYTDDSVKRRLKSLQRDKCCYCEAKVTHIYRGDVEHFRPKAAYKQDSSSKIKYPGYYWLTYRWSNLYFACQICNEVNKLNFFPLRNKKHRADPSTRKIADEVPLIVDPGGSVNPELHIHFKGCVPTSRNLMGRLTIKYLKLDRSELNERREEKLNLMNTLREIVEITNDSKETATAEKKFLATLNKHVHPKSEYSSMFKSNFRKYLKLL